MFSLMNRFNLFIVGAEDLEIRTILIFLNIRQAFIDPQRYFYPTIKVIQSGYLIGCQISNGQNI